MAKWDKDTRTTALSEFYRIGSVTEAARTCGVPKTTLERWIETDKKNIQGGDKHQTEQREAYIKHLERSNTLHAVIGKVIEKAACSLTPGPVATKFNPKDYLKDMRTEEWAAMISDAHIGAKTDATKTGGLGNYNFEVFLKYMEKYKQSLKQIIAIYSKAIPVKRFNFFLLGDLIDGMGIFRGQSRQVDQGLADQMVFCVDEFSKLFSEFASIFSEVGVYCVVGNHGRIGKKGEFEPVRDNLEYAIYNFIKHRLKEHKNVSVNVADSWWMAVKRNGHTFYMLHGDTFKAWNSIPFYGAIRNESRAQKLVTHDWFLSAHHHAPAQFDNIFMNGSWSGASEFSLHDLTVGTLPIQKVFKIHPNYLTSFYDVQLALKKDFTPKIFE